MSFLFPRWKGAEGGGVRVFLLFSAAPLWCLGRLRGTTWGVWSACGRLPSWVGLASTGVGSFES